MKKVIPMIIIIMIILLIPIITLIGDDWLSKLTESEMKEIYKIEIHPEKLTDGIKTGRVILYGHYVKGPYKVEKRGDSLFINGVRIFPQLMPRLFKHKYDSIKTLQKKNLEELRKRHDVYRDEVRPFLKKQETLFNELVQKKGYETAKDTLINILKNFKYISSVKIALEKKGMLKLEIGYYFSGEINSYKIIFLYHTYTYDYEKTKEDSIRIAKERRIDSINKAWLEEGLSIDNDIKAIIEGLKKGEVVEVYVDSYNSTEVFDNYIVIDDRTLAEQIYRIENDKLKLQYDIHLTLYCNYDPSEWPSLNEVLLSVYGEKRYKYMGIKRMIQDILPSEE